MSEQRDRDIEALAECLEYHDRLSPHRLTPKSIARHLLDGPVAAMIAEAERRGAVKALRDAAADRRLYTANELAYRADAIERGEQP